MVPVEYARMKVYDSSDAPIFVPAFTDAYLNAGIKREDLATFITTRYSDIPQVSSITYDVLVNLERGRTHAVDLEGVTICFIALGIHFEIYGIMQYDVYIKRALERMRRSNSPVGKRYYSGYAQELILRISGQ